MKLRQPGREGSARLRNINLRFWLGLLQARRFGYTHIDYYSVATGIPRHIDKEVRLPVIAEPWIAGPIDDDTGDAHERSEARRAVFPIKTRSVMQQHLLAGRGQRVARWRRDWIARH
jgi:hypothetical protein